MFFCPRFFVFNIGNGFTSTSPSAISGGLDSDQFTTRGNWVHYQCVALDQLELHQDASEQIANTGTWIDFGSDPSVLSSPCTITSEQRFYIKNDSGGDLTLQLEIATNHNFVGNDSIALLTGSSVTYTKVT